MTIRERLKQFIEFKGISTLRFEKECGLSVGFVRNIAKTISVEKVEKILKAFPEISMNWLVSGEGEMIRSDNTEPVANNGEILHLKNEIKRLEDIIDAKNETIQSLKQLIEHLTK